MKNQILDVLENIDGGRATFAGLNTLTVPKMRKTHPENRKVKNPFFGRVTKQTLLTVRLNTNYEQSVRNRQEREHKTGNFVAKTSWYIKVNDAYNGCISSHKKTGKLYLNYIEEKKISVQYFLDGQPVSREQFKAISVYFTATPKKVAEQLEITAERQGVNKPVVFKVVALDNITSLSVNGQKVTKQGIVDSRI